MGEKVANLPKAITDISPEKWHDKTSHAIRARYMLTHVFPNIAWNEDFKQFFSLDAGIWTPFKLSNFWRMIEPIHTENNVTYSESTGLLIYKTMPHVSICQDMPPTRLDCLAFENGILNVTTRQFELGIDPKYGMTGTNGIVWRDMRAATPLYDAFMDRASGGDKLKRDTLEAILFAIFTRQYDWQLFYEITGEGGSGKSIFKSLATMLVGQQNVGSLSSLEILDKVGGFLLEGLLNKSLIVMNEINNYRGRASGLKIVTGGDEITIYRKWMTPVTLVLPANFLLTNNEPCEFLGAASAMNRRRILFAFPYAISEAEKDPAFLSKLQHELPDIIRHLLEKFPDAEDARQVLIEWRDSPAANALKAANDPIRELCAYLQYTDNDLERVPMGGHTSVQNDYKPMEYLYHFYEKMMIYSGRERQIDNVKNFSVAVKETMRLMYGLTGEQCEQKKITRGRYKDSMGYPFKIMRAPWCGPLPPDTDEK